MAALGCGGERGGEVRWLWRGVGGARTEASVGVSGRRDRGGAAWRPYPLVVAGERVRRGRAPVPTRVGGTGKGGGRGRRAGSAGWARWVSWARWPRGVWGVFLSLSFFLFFIFFFSVLFHFKVFSLLLKMCFLHHNYLCNIWRPPNIFVSILKTFIVLTLIQI